VGGLRRTRGLAQKPVAQNMCVSTGSSACACQNRRHCSSSCLAKFVNAQRRLSQHRAGHDIASITQNSRIARSQGRGSCVRSPDETAGSNSSETDAPPLGNRRHLRAVGVKTDGKISFLFLFLYFFWWKRDRVRKIQVGKRDQITRKYENQPIRTLSRKE